MSKEEIEKAKERLKNLEEDAALFSTGWKERLKDNEKQAIETLLQYIDQLEQENNKQNKIKREMENYIADVDYTGNICALNKCDENIDCCFCVKQYFEEKVEKK